MSQSPIEKIPDNQFAVSWAQVYTKIAQLFCAFDDRRMCDTSIEIECKSCRTRFSFAQLMDVAALSSFAGFIGLSDKMRQFDPLLLQLSRTNSDNWTCPRCSSDKALFSWRGTDLNDFSLFSSVFSLGPKKPWDVRLNELTSFLSSAHATSQALETMKSFGTEELKRALPSIEDAIRTNPICLVTLLGEQSTERLRKFLLTLPEAERAIGSNPLVLSTFLGEQSTEGLRRFACQAASKMGTEEALLAVLQSGDALARACSAEILSEIGTVRSIDLLKLALESDPDPYVREMAARALSRASSRPPRKTG